MSRPANDKAALRDLAHRLKIAMDQSDQIPPANKGRQTTLARMCGVSQETARNWINGTHRPTPAKIETLAEVLDVDESWLAFGISPSGTKRRPELLMEKAGAVYYVFGLLSLFGRSPAFVNDSAYELAAVVDNRIQYFTVALAVEQSDGSSYVAEVPVDRRPESQVLVLIPDTATGDVVTLAPRDGDIAEHGDTRGGFVELTFVRRGKRFVLNKRTVPEANLYAFRAA